VTATSSAGPRDGREEFVRAWARVLAHTSYIRMTRAESDEFLRGLLRRMETALRAEPFSNLPGHEIGTDLVNADYAAPAALGRTVAVIQSRLLDDLGLTEAKYAERLPKLLEAVTIGGSQAQRHRILDEQDAIQVAARTAKEDFEHELRQAQARFWHAKAHDPLTGLPNRGLFHDKLTDACDATPEDGRIGLCAVDLDRFRAVNDNLGPAVGDALLIAVSERLADLAGELGHEIAHRGADEFVLLVKDTTGVDDAVAVAEEILARLSAPFPVGGREISVTASVGVVERPVAEAGPTDLMRAADVTLHWAKAEGGGRWVVFDADRNAEQVARYELAAAMPGACERGEFTLAFQPLVDLSDGTVRGVEALARWRHPEHGLMTADRFIGLAEHSGLIVPLGAQLLEEACREAVRWPGTDVTAPYVSVNLAVRQICDPRLAEAVDGVLKRTGLPPHRLQLEITESAMMDTGTRAYDTLRALGALGVRVAIDDFGTGYSNLAYLRTLPVLHGIKLARGFVEGLGAPEPADPTDDALVTALVSLAHTLGLAVTAEGVETAAQADRLRALDCDTAQGWHLGHPMCAEDLRRMFAVGPRTTRRPACPAG
jgi:diguanylate cyclase